MSQESLSKSVKILISPRNNEQQIKVAILIDQSTPPWVPDNLAWESAHVGEYDDSSKTSYAARLVYFLKVPVDKALKKVSLKSTPALLSQIEALTEAYYKHHKDLSI